MANRKATITVNWPIANLQAKLDVEAPELRTSFSISIEGLVEDTLDGGYPYIPSSDTSALYKIDLTDNLGTTDAEWVQKYNAGYLTFSRESSYVSIVVSNGALYMQMVTKGTGAILERSITARIRNDGHGTDLSATTYYRHPPFGATITIRNYEVVHSSSAVSLVNSGVFFNIEMRISGTNGSNISEEEFYKLVYYGIYNLSYGSSTSSTYIQLDPTNRWIILFMDATSVNLSNTYNLYQGWNGDNLTSTKIVPTNWYPKSTYTTFCLVMLFSNYSQINSSTSFRYETGSNMYLDISSTWTGGDTSDESQPNTYGKKITASDIKNLYDKRPSTFSSGYYPYLTLGVRDSRITAIHLHNYLDSEYYSSTSRYRRMSCSAYIRSYRYSNKNSEKFLFIPEMYEVSGGDGWYDSGTGYVNDDDAGVQIVTIGTSFKYINADTPSCGYSSQIVSNNPEYDYISLSFYHKGVVDSGDYQWHTSYYVYLDFSDASSAGWNSNYIYANTSSQPAGSSYMLITYQINSNT